MATPAPAQHITCPGVDRSDAAALRLAVELACAALAAGAVLVVPTETFYGLCVRADDAAALARLAALKGRPEGKAMATLAADAAQVRAACAMPDVLMPLARAFWPGPLTLAVPPRGAWPAAVLGPGGTLGVRVSAHPFARALAAAVGQLLTATSANLAGEPAVARLDDLDPALRRACVLVDGGVLPGGRPSTLVQAEPAAAVGPAGVRVLRDGAIDRAALRTQLSPEVPLL